MSPGRLTAPDGAWADGAAEAMARSQSQSPTRIATNFEPETLMESPCAAVSVVTCGSGGGYGGEPSPFPRYLTPGLAIPNRVSGEKVVRPKRYRHGPFELRIWRPMAPARS